MIKILCLVGESGSGKSTIAGLLSKDDKYNYVQSYTTRQKRSNNEEGHIFADELVYKKHKELDAYVDNPLKIIAETYFDGNYYWTVNTQFLKDKINVYAVDPKGVDELKELKQFDILVIYLKANEQIRRERMVDRMMKEYRGINAGWNFQISQATAYERMLHDREVFKVIKTDYVIDSDRVPKETLEDVKEVMEEWI